MQTVLITGATKNTGLAIAEKFASEGFCVALTSRSEEAARRAAHELERRYNVRARGYALNLSDVQDIARVFDAIDRDFGRLDVFVANSAHLGVDQDMLKVTEEEYDAVMSVNLKGTYFCCQQAVRRMARQGKGSVVLISSVHSKECIWGRSLYTASKGALNALARSIAIEFGSSGVRANAIIAGAIKTERWEGLTEEQIAAKRANWPIGLESTGEDIANGAYYLGSDLSKTVTGTELTIDSGVLVSLLPYNGGRKA